MPIGFFSTVHVQTVLAHHFSKHTALTAVFFHYMSLSPSICTLGTLFRLCKSEVSLKLVIMVVWRTAICKQAPDSGCNQKTDSLTHRQG